MRFESPSASLSHRSRRFYWPPHSGRLRLGRNPIDRRPTSWRWSVLCRRTLTCERCHTSRQRRKKRRFRLTRHPFPLAGGQIQQSQFTQQLMQRVLTPIPNMPSPILTFAGMNSTQSGCGCFPPDTDGDVGPNHYIQFGQFLDQDL